MEEFKEIKDRFFASYKSFVDCLMLTHKDFSMYSILVFKKKEGQGLSKVNITIRNSHNNQEILNEYSNNVILPDTLAEELIEDIRNDFKDNHIISYSVVNPKDHIQTLQNTKFSLNIVLNTEQDLEAAMKFNSKINSDSSRFKRVLKIY